MEYLFASISLKAVLISIASWHYGTKFDHVFTKANPAFLILITTIMFKLLAKYVSPALLRLLSEVSMFENLVSSTTANHCTIEVCRGRPLMVSGHAVSLYH